MRNKIKFVILGGILSLSLLPIIASASVTLTTAQKARVSWGWSNSTSCNVWNNYNTASPVSAGGGLGSADIGSFILDPLVATAGSYYALNCYSDPASPYGGALIQSTDWITVTQAAPTTAPSLSINPGSGLTTADFTLSWTASNNNPADYCMTVVGPGININDRPTCALSQGTALSFTNHMSAFGLGAGTYTFTIYACNGGGCSANSNAVTYTATAPIPPPTPTVNVNFSLLDKLKTSFNNIFTVFKNFNLIDKTLASTSK